MSKRAIAEILVDLVYQAESLGGDGDRHRTTLWFVRAADTLALFLPVDSQLRRTFTKFLDENDRAESAEVPPVAVDLIRIAYDQNRVRPDDTQLAEVRQDLNIVMGEIFTKSWWFRIPVAALLAAVAFAFGGVIQLANINVDIRERVAAAEKKAEQEIDTQKTEIAKALKQVGDDARNQVSKQLTTELTGHVNSAKGDITAAAQSYVKDLQRQKAPDLEAAFATSRYRTDVLQRSVAASERKLSDLQVKTEMIQRGMAQITKVGNASGFWQRLSIYLDRSRNDVLIATTTLGAAIVLSTIALVVSLRRRRW